MNRRSFLLTAGASCAVVLLGDNGSQALANTGWAPFRFSFGNYSGKRMVNYRGNEKPGTIIVDTSERRLLYVLSGGKAMSYGVGVGRQGFTWSGVATVGRKAEWPEWRPPQEMIERELRQYNRRLPDVMPGGPNNPLGARALYLYQNGQDTLYRIHGTNAPTTIGQAVSSGCIRMLNDEVVDLFNRVEIGTKVVVLN